LKLVLTGLLDGSPPSSRATRVFCEGSTIPGRHCTIFNLCLDPTRQSFVFLVANDSVYHGLPRFQSSVSMLGLVDLSTMPNHNVFWLEYFPLLLQSVEEQKLKLRLVHILFFLKTRFNPYKNV
jgi:hypothetical protein